MMGRKSSADEGPVHSPKRPSPCNEKTTKHETQQNKPKTKQAKEQQLKQNKEVIAGDTGPYSTLQENGVP